MLFNGLFPASRNRRGLGGFCKRISQRNDLQLRLERIKRGRAGSRNLRRLTREQIEVVVGKLNIKIAEGKIHAARQHRRCYANLVAAIRAGGFHLELRRLQMHFLDRRKIDKVARDLRAARGQLGNDNDALKIYEEFLKRSSSPRQIKIYIDSQPDPKRADLQFRFRIGGSGGHKCGLDYL